MDNYSISNSVTDASAKMGSNVIGDHKIHLNMNRGYYGWFTVVLRCGYCTVSFQSLVFRHLVIAPARNINKLPK